MDRKKFDISKMLYERTNERMVVVVAVRVSIVLIKEIDFHFTPHLFDRFHLP